MQVKRLVAIACGLLASVLSNGAEATQCGGILHFNGQACCPSACGQCGGNGCHNYPGGEQSCCSSQISKSGRSCDNSPPPCWIGNGNGNGGGNGNNNGNVNNSGAMAAGGNGTGGATNAQTSSNINVVSGPGSGPVFVYAPVQGGTAVGGAGTGGGAAANNQPQQQQGFMRGSQRPFFLP